MNTPVIKRQIVATWAKFLIGFIAGFSAITVPRLSSILGANGAENAVFFDTNYLILVIAFAILVGAIISIMEFHTPKEPKETFWAALALPGLIAGAVNTAMESDNASTAQSKLAEASQIIRQHGNIKKQSIDDFSLPPEFSGVTNGPTSRSDVGFSFIRNAHAASKDVFVPQQKDSWGGLSTKHTVPEYVIAIDEVADLSVAKQKFALAKQKFPGATVIKAGGKYIILHSNKLYTEFDASQIALKLKKEHNLQPTLISRKQK